MIDDSNLLFNVHYYHPFLLQDKHENYFLSSNYPLSEEREGVLKSYALHLLLLLFFVNKNI